MEFNFNKHNNCIDEPDNREYNNGEFKFVDDPNDDGSIGYGYDRDDEE